MSPAAAIALSGMTAATLKLNASASNLANANDTSAVGSDGHTPVQVEDSAATGGGVVARAVAVRPATLIAYDPASPLATAKGLIDTPDINPITEITNQLQARQAFAFSLEALRVAEEEQKSLLDVTT